jgi:ribose transport system substrate-binding protein
MKRGFVLLFISVILLSFAVFFNAAEKKVTEGEPTARLSDADKAIVEEAQKATKARMAKQTEWFGPSTGPKAAVGKKIVILDADSQNPIEAAWGKATAEAARVIGWEASIIDGKGNPQSWKEAFDQAIAMKADGVVLSASAEALQAPITRAVERGIFVVGIHASDVPGPDPKNQLLYNCTSSPNDIGAALADYVIADSNGTGRAIILYDALFAIARHKAEAMKTEFERCSSVELLEYLNSPIAQVSDLMPQVGIRWVQKYGGEGPFYVMCIADYYFDFVVPSYRIGGVNPEDVQLLGSDGTAKAYSRIRNGEYQTVTIPEPSLLFGYQAVDSLNRAFNGEEPYTWSQPVYIVTRDNIDEEGGDQDQFIPSNNFVERYKKIWGVK